MEVDFLHLPVVVRRVMFGKIISQVCCIWFPSNAEVVLFDLILNQIEAHVHGF